MNAEAEKVTATGTGAVEYAVFGAGGGGDYLPGDTSHGAADLSYEGRDSGTAKRRLARCHISWREAIAENPGLRSSTFTYEILRWTGRDWALVPVSIKEAYDKLHGRQTGRKPAKASEEAELQEREERRKDQKEHDGRENQPDRDKGRHLEAAITAFRYPHDIGVPMEVWHRPWHAISDERGDWHRIDIQAGPVMDVRKTVARLPDLPRNRAYRHLEDIANTGQEIL